MQRAERCQNVHDVQCGIPDCSVRAVPEAETELAGMAKELTAVPRDRYSLRHQLTDADQRMSEVSAAHDALQQEMMELTQEQRCVLTKRHIEVKRVHTRTRSSNNLSNYKSCDGSSANS